MKGKETSGVGKKKPYALCFCLAAALLVAGFTGCERKAEVEDAASQQEEEQPLEVHDFNEDENSNLGAWGRAMGSVLISMNEGNPYYFGGYEANQANQEAAVNILEKSWSVKDRSQLLEQIQQLLDTGARKEFIREAREMNRMSPRELKKAMKQLSGDLLIHYKLVQYNWKTWKKKGLLAWDMCRVSHLAQWGYIAGYLNREEAQAVIEPAAARLHDRFTDWDEVQNNWLDGYALYGNIDRKQAGNDYEKRLQVYEELRQAQPEEGALYDDRLFQEEIVPISSVSYQDLIKEQKLPEQKKKKNDLKEKSEKQEPSEAKEGSEEKE